MNSSSAGFRESRRQQGMQLPVVLRLTRRLRVHERADAEEIGLVESLTREAGGERLEREAGLEDLVESGFHEMEVQNRRVDDRLGAGLDDDQPAPGPSAHGGDLLVLHETDGLPEHRPAHAVLLEQRGLRAEHLTDRPVLCHHVGEDPRRDRGGELRHR